MRFWKVPVHIANKVPEGSGTKTFQDFKKVLGITHGFIPECVARVPVSLGGLGVRLCSPSFAFAAATVRNRLRYRRKALHSGECVWRGPEAVSN